jgi:hypothetical protein
MWFYVQQYITLSSATFEAAERGEQSIHDYGFHYFESLRNAVIDYGYTNKVVFGLVYLTEGTFKSSENFRPTL